MHFSAVKYAPSRYSNSNRHETHVANASSKHDYMHACQLHHCFILSSCHVDRTDISSVVLHCQFYALRERLEETATYVLRFQLYYCLFVGKKSNYQPVNCT